MKCWNRIACWGFVLSVLARGLLPAAAEPVRLILDTDMGNDVDDALALAMIHALENRGEVRLLAVTITKDNRDAATFIDLVNHFYGRPEVPIGVVHNGKTPEDAPMLKIPVERRDARGNFVYPRRLGQGATSAPEAVGLLKRILSEQPDGSVTIAQIGFSTNLARLVSSREGRALAARKVKALYLMAGNFQKPKREYNVFTDAAAFQDLMQNWPGEIVFSGFEIGLQISYPFESIQRDFAWATDHPIVEAYQVYVGKAEDHPNWDSTAVLEAIRPGRGYFDLSPPGNVALGADDITVFKPDPQGKCRYLVLKQEQVSRIRELISALVSEPPLTTGHGAAPQRLAF